MNQPFANYNRKDQPEFIKELRKNVQQYFKENNLSRHANLSMKLKTVFMVSLYFVPFILILTGVVSTIWPVLAMWGLMGLGMAGIGLSIMHDANHGSYSTNKHVNTALGFLANFLGAYHINWKIQHNVLHHSFTNVHGLDEDIETPGMRFSPNQKKRFIYRFQAFYAPMMYGLMTMNWFLTKDFLQLARFHRKGLLSGQGKTLKQALTELILHKVWYLALTLILPLILTSSPWWYTVVGFVSMQFICGVFLAFIFQTAHVVSDTQFYVPDESGGLENNWAIHQMLTTANFKTKTRFFSWFIGGLNYQIEHHLFPNICHVHYRKISKIVRETAQKYNVPYNEYHTFFSALRSHFVMLHNLGTGKVG